MTLPDDNFGDDNNTIDHDLTSDELVPDGRTQEFLDRDEANIFEQYAAIVRRLRAPDGCPWDRKQTLNSLRRFIVEESFELLAAINDHQKRKSVLSEARIPDEDEPGSAENNTLHHVAEELGDVFLVTLLLADALKDAGGPSLQEILKENGRKLIRRHPHVFSDVVAEDEQTVVANWNEIKRNVENKPESVAYVSNGLPPLERAQEIQKKAAHLGFDWPDAAPVIEKIREETDELHEALQAAHAGGGALRDNHHIEQEIGDLLFSVVNLSRKVKTDASVALAGTNERFLERFTYIENEVARSGVAFTEYSLDALDRLWNEAKNDTTD